MTYSFTIAIWLRLKSLITIARNRMIFIRKKYVTQFMINQDKFFLIINNKSKISNLNSERMKATLKFKIRIQLKNTLVIKI